MGLPGFAFNDGIPNAHCNPYNESLLDRVVCRRVAERLLAQPGLCRRTIDITVHNGVVIIEGTVADDASKRLVTDIAWTTPDVFDVSNRLQVA